jgi:hypothetical protein
MADEGEVHANLMRAARFGRQLEQRRVREAPQHRKMRHRRPPARQDGHPLSVERIAADRRVDRPFVFFHHALRQRDVAFRHRAVRPLPQQRRPRPVGLGDNHQA